MAENKTNAEPSADSPDQEERPDVLAKISSDRPVRSLADDSYGLSNSVVPRLYRAAVDWPASEGLILGLHGPWGIGKSSVLNMLEDYVTTHEERPNVLTVRFNPWFYDDQAALITSFFGTIAAHIGAQEGENWEQIGSTLKKMGTFLSAASSGVSLLGVKFDVASIIETLKTAGEAASALDRGERELEETRTRLEQVLSEFAARGGRLVILVDDVDRLTRPELLGLFRLLRVVGDLPAVTIIVAMDDVRVHQLLTTQADPDFGKSFVEKIVQAAVPVPYPTPNAISTRVADGLNAVLTEAEFEVSEDLRLPEWEIDKRRPITLLTRLIHTPRDLARYFNSLRLFLLAGAAPADVHATDAVLIEALRVFYPDVYMRVQRNREFFVDKSFSAFDGRSGRSEEVEVRRRKKLQSIISGGATMPAADSEIVEDILTRLFGDITETKISPEVRSELNDQRRIASPDFFANYFSLYPVEGLITKKEMNDFLESVVSAAETDDHTQVAEVVATSIAGRPRDQISQMASELNAELKRLPIPLVAVAAKGVAAAVSDQNDTVFLSLFVSFVEALKARPWIYSQRDDGEEEAASAKAVEILALALREFSLPGAATLVDHLAAVLWLSDEEKAQLAATWLERFQAADDGELYLEDSPEATTAIWGAARRATVHAASDEAELMTEIRQRLCRMLKAEPRRLPIMLHQVSVMSGGNVYLRSDIRSDKKLLQTLDNVFGLECLKEVAENSTGSDRHDLLPELRGFLDETDGSKDPSASEAEAL